MIGGAASSSARSAGSDRARIRLRASSARYIGSAKSMPKNITKGWKTCGSKVSSTPLMPTALSSKSVLEQMMQPVPADEATASGGRAAVRNRKALGEVEVFWHRCATASGSAVEARAAPAYTMNTIALEASHLFSSARPSCTLYRAPQGIFVQSRRFHAQVSDQIHREDANLQPDLTRLFLRWSDGLRMAT